ncbi:MAG: choice-of-anchor J domain-containing protein, partial [Chitinophagaceae bacterium]|nr:choice-of-anchor J domain-containing protein [Chitinophagaceae bacterium]
MRKFYALLVIALLSFTVTLQAQVSSYIFSSSSGTYTPITGGTLLRDGTATMDSWASTAQTIPSFTFNGTAYTTAYVTSNGLLTLGGSAPSTFAYTAISTTTGSGYAICPFNADLDKVNSNANSEIRWETVGDEVVFQWKQMKRYNVTESFDMQARLNTVTGEIVFVYQLNSGPGSSTSYQPQVGIRASASDYNNRLVASGSENWASSLKGTANSSTCRFTSSSPQKNFTSGLTYTWTPATCFAPTNVASSAITTTTATISWDDATPVPGMGYDWELRTSGAAGSGATGLVQNDNTADVTLDLTSLTANTAYNFYIRSNCGGGNDTSTWTNALQFTTPCDAISSFPWTENFDAVTTPALPSCFASLDVNADGDKWITYTGGYGVGGSIAAGLYTDINAGNNDDYLVLPAFDLTGNQRFRFSVRARSSGEPNDYRVVISTTGNTPADFASGTELKSLTTVSSTTHANIDWIDLSAYTGIAYIAIHVPPGGLDGYYLYVDDMIVEDIPSCLPPTNVASSAVAATTATISWDDATPVPGMGYDWELRTSGNPGSGATGLVQNDNTADVTLDLTSLTASTTYRFYIRSNCGGGNDTSAWTSALQFTTPCADISTLPYTQNFNAVGIPVCWSTALVSGTNNWVVGSTSPGGFADIAAPLDGNYVAKAYGTSTANLISAPFDLSSLAGNQGRISFYTYRHSATVPADEINFYINTEPNTSGATLLTTIKPLTTQAPTEASAGWYNYTADIPLSFNSSGSVYFIIQGVTTSGVSSYDLGIDNFIVEESPSCLPPTNLASSAVAATTATISWDDATPVPGMGYDWELRTSGAAGSGATGLVQNDNTADATLDLTSLTANTEYWFYIRSNCGGGDDTSSWASIKVTTAVSIPWVEEFDAAPAGWVVTAGSWYVGSTRGATGNPGGNLYMNLYSSAATGTFITPSLATVSIGDKLAFDYKLSNYSSPFAPPSSWGSFDVSISTDNGATWDALETVNAPAIAGWTNKSYDLDAYAGATVKIKIEATRTAGDYDLAFDNFMISPACTAPVAQPTALILTPGATTVTGSFTAASPLPSGYLVVRTDGSTPADPVDGTTYTIGASDLGGVIVANGAATTFSATGLTPGDTYSFFVYSYNNTDCAGIAYLATSPLTDNVTTSSTYTSIVSGNWEDGSTWDLGTAPGASNDVIIADGHTVTVNATAATASLITVNSGGELIVSDNTLTTVAITNNGTVTVSGGTTNVTGAATTGITNNTGSTFTINGGIINLGPAGGGDRTFANNGILTVTNGSLNINGNFALSAGGKLNQSGGVISIDGNNAGSAIGSVATATNLFNLAPTANADVNLSGGSIIIVDPHYSTGYSVFVSVPNSGAITATGTHTFQFGDGVSTDNGGSNGFYVFTWQNSGAVQYKNVVLAPVVGGTNRFVLQGGYAGGDTYGVFTLSGDLTIGSGAEFRAIRTANTSPLVIGGNLINNGTLTSSGIAYFGNAVTTSAIGISYSASSNAQTISGSGIFRNTVSSPTTNFSALTVNNNNVSGVTFGTGINNPSFSGEIIVTTGKVNVNNINFNGTTSVSLAAAASIINANSVIHNTAGNISLSGSGSLNVSGSFAFGNVNSRTFTSGGRMVLKSTELGTARIADITNGGANSGNAISGNVIQERYIPAKAERKWIFLSSPVTQSVANSWQQQIHITGAGTGGTVCPTLTTN